MRWWALAALLGTAALGTLLRLSWTAPDFAVPLTARPDFLRHAHSHLGFYAVLFPTIWLVWQGWAPRGRLGHAYCAVSFATAGLFLHSGYSIPAIVGSTLVGAGWGIFAWRAGLWRLGGDARGAVGPAIVVALCFVPPIGVLTPRDPALAEQLVRTFLSVLLLGAGLPALLRGPRDTPAWLWLVATLAASAGGGLHVPVARTLGYLTLAVLIIRHLRGTFDPLLGPQWLMAAAGFVAYAAHLLPPDRGTAIAGAHFLLLGPVATTLLFRTRPGRTPSAAWLYLMLVGVMSGVLAAMGRGLFDELGLQRVAAAVGAAIACLILVFLSTSLMRRTQGSR